MLVIGTCHRGGKEEIVFKPEPCHYEVANSRVSAAKARATTAKETLETVKQPQSNH
jgi:hypothetical protein